MPVGNLQKGHIFPLYILGSVIPPHELVATALVKIFCSETTDEIKSTLTLTFTEFWLYQKAFDSTWLYPTLKDSNWFLNDLSWFPFSSISLITSKLEFHLTVSRANRFDSSSTEEQNSLTLNRLPPCNPHSSKITACNHQTLRIVVEYV